MAQKQDLTLLYTLMVISVVISAFSLMFVSDLLDNNESTDFHISRQNTAINQLTSSVDSLEYQFNKKALETKNTSKEYVLTKAEFEEEATEQKAKDLAKDSVSLINRDFSKAVYKAIEDFGEDIEDRDDVYYLSYQYEVSEDDDEVRFEKVKVYYFIDGDSEETYKARFKDFTVEILDLDFDDDFNDAEVDEDYLDELEVSKVYER